MITDKLASYGAARGRSCPAFEHRQHKGLNNRAAEFAPARHADESGK